MDNVAPVHQVVDQAITSSQLAISTTHATDVVACGVTGVFCQETIVPSV